MERSQHPGWKRDESLDVGIPKEKIALYRLLTSASLDAIGFVPDCTWRIKYGFESQATYCSFSAFDSLEAAEEALHTLAGSRPEKGLEPFTHIAEFDLRPGPGPAVAWRPPDEGHCLVWADPVEVSSRARIVFPTN